MTYATTDLDPHAVASLRRDRSGLFEFEHRGRTLRTKRADIAEMLDGLAPTRTKSTASPHRAAVLRRAELAVARADALLGRTRRTETRSKPLTPAQRSTLDGVSNSTMAEAMGELLGRELRKRDERLNALERRQAAGDPAGVLARARAAQARAEALLA